MKTTFIAIFSLLLIGSVLGQSNSNQGISGSVSCSGYWIQLIRTVVLTDTLSGVSMEAQVDSSGLFTFLNVPVGRTYRFSLKSELPPVDTFQAVSVLDMVKISQHILGIQNLDTLAQRAADMNESFGVTTFDLVQIMRALQGKNVGRDGIRKASVLWQGGKLLSHNIIPNFTTSIRDLQFIYYIKGDVDGSGCP